MGTIDTIKVLLTRTASSAITEEVICCAIDGKSLIKLELLLDEVGTLCLSSKMIDLATLSGDMEIMKALLAHSEAAMISEDMVLSAARSPYVEMLEWMLSHGGEITQNVLTEVACGVSPEVLEMLLQHGCEINGDVLKAAANHCWWGPQEGLSLLLKRVDDTVIAQEVPGLLHAVAENCGWQVGTMSQLLDRTDKTIVAPETVGLLHTMLSNASGGATLIGQLLDQTDATVIAKETESLLLAITKSRFADVEMMRLLLQGAENSAITEDVFMAAILNEDEGNELVQMLLERGGSAEITEDVALQAVKRLKLEVVRRVLGCIEAKNISDDLLEAAAANYDYGDESIRLLLKETEAKELSNTVLIAAARNYSKGKEVVAALEEGFGPIQMTENTLLMLLGKGLPTEYLLERIEPALITRKILVAALKVGDSVWGDSELSCAIAEKSVHIPITLDVLEAAIRSGSYDCFRFLWNRARMNEVPQSLIREAAKHNDSRILEFLLDEAKESELEESVFIASAIHNSYPTEIYESLLDRGIPLKITSNVIKAALANSEERVCNSSTLQWLLDRSINVEVVDEMFRLAATRGRIDYLNYLSKYGGMETSPGKWLEVAELRNAAYHGDSDTLQDLLDRSVDPDIADPNGKTPLYLAVRFNHELSVRMLLSAGAKPDPLVDQVHQVTLLYGSAGLGRYEIVKLLVEAGASLDFRDEDGKTPAMITRWRGHLKVYRYLKECEKNRMEGKHGISGSA